MRALIFDLDGTLVDTVYAHVMAWQRALGEGGMDLAAWWIHRRVGMGIAAFVREAAHSLGRETTPEEIVSLQTRWREHYAAYLPVPRPLPGALELLALLRAESIPHGITTGSQRPEIDASLEALGVDGNTPVVEGTEVTRGKPEPDLFLLCAQRLGVRAEQCCVVGDGVHDQMAAKRAGMEGFGLLTGGQREEELRRAGATRIFQDPAELLGSLGELGFLSPLCPAQGRAL